MAVKGDGLDDAETEVGKHTGDAVILKISSDETVGHSQPDCVEDGWREGFLTPSCLHKVALETKPENPASVDHFQLSRRIDEWRDPVAVLLRPSI